MISCKSRLALESKASYSSLGSNQTPQQSDDRVKRHFIGIFMAFLIWPLRMLFRQDEVHTAIDYDGEASVAGSAQNSNRALIWGTEIRDSILTSEAHPIY